MDDYWKRMMRQWLHRCPHCGVTLLIFGAPQIDEYSCKMCGKRFALMRDTNDTEVESSGADHRERSDQVA